MPKRFIPDIEGNPLKWFARVYRDVSPGNTGSELERKHKMLEREHEREQKKKSRNS